MYYSPNKQREYLSEIPFKTGLTMNTQNDTVKDSLHVKASLPHHLQISSTSPFHSQGAVNSPNFYTPRTPNRKDNFVESITPAEEYRATLEVQIKEKRRKLALEKQSRDIEAWKEEQRLEKERLELQKQSRGDVSPPANATARFAWEQDRQREKMLKAKTKRNILERVQNKENSKNLVVNTSKTEKPNSEVEPINVNISEIEKPNNEFDSANTKEKKQNYSTTCSKDMNTKEKKQNYSSEATTCNKGMSDDECSLESSVCTRNGKSVSETNIPKKQHQKSCCIIS